MTLSTNETDYFPKFNIPYLKERIENRTVKRFDGLPLKRITLYRYFGQYTPQLKVTTQYVIVFDVDASWKELNEEQLERCRDLDISTGWMGTHFDKDVFGYWGLDESFKDVYKRPKDDYLKDWKLFLRLRPCKDQVPDRPGFFSHRFYRDTSMGLNGETPKGIMVNEPHLVLYEINPIPKTEARPGQGDPTPFSPSVPDSAAAEKEPEYENFVRRLRVFYENDTEIKTQSPGKPSKSLNFSILGFQSKEARPWEVFLEILQSPDHTYSCGPSTLGKANEARKNPEYDHRQKRLKSLSTKLVDGLNKVYSAGIPEKYLLFELVSGKQGTYKPKFKIEDRLGISPIEEKYDRYSKDRLLKEIENLHKTYKDAQAEVEDGIANSIFAKLGVAVTVAHRKKWLNDDEVKELILPDEYNGNIPGLDLSNQDSHKLLYGDNLED